MVKAVETVNLHQYGEIQRSRDLIDVLLQMQLLLEDFQQSLIHAVLHLKTDGLSPLPLFQLLLDLLEKIRRLILLDCQVSVSHDTEGVSAHNVIIQEELVDVLLYDLLEQNDLLRPAARRQLHDPVEHRGHLHGGKLQLLLAVLLSDKGSDIQRLIPDERERSRGVHRHGRQNRINIFFKVLIDIECLLGCQILMSADDL